MKVPYHCVYKIGVQHPKRATSHFCADRLVLLLLLLLHIVFLPAGRDVAIKVIGHSTANMSAIHCKANLLMSLRAPNVVQALHYVTYTKADDTAPVAAAESAAVSSMLDILQRSAPSRISSSSSGGIRCAVFEDSSKHSLPAHGNASIFVPLYGGRACGGSSSSSAMAALAQPQQQQQRQLEPLPSLDVYVPACPGSAAAVSAASAAARCTGQLTPAESFEAVQPAAVEQSAVQQLAETHLVLEFCNAGTLAAVAEGWRRDTGERDRHMLERLVLLRDVALGLQELHNQDAVHGHLVSAG
jgi:hypothetical protein